MIDILDFDETDFGLSGLDINDEDTLSLDDFSIEQDANMTTGTFLNNFEETSNYDIPDDQGYDLIQKDSSQSNTSEVSFMGDKYSDNEYNEKMGKEYTQNEVKYREMEKEASVKGDKAAAGRFHDKAETYKALAQKHLSRIRK